MTPREELIKICDEFGYDINNLTEDNWEFISMYKYISEEFIEEYKDYLDSFNISAFQKLSVSFIEKHKDWLRPFYISKYQKFSECFIEKYHEWLSMSYIQRCKFMSDTLINRMEFKVDEDNNKLFKI